MYMKTADFLEVYGLTDNEAPYLRPAREEVRNEIAAALSLALLLVVFTILTVAIS